MLSVAAVWRLLPGKVWAGALVLALVLGWGAVQRHRAGAAAKTLQQQQAAAASQRERALAQELTRQGAIATAQGKAATDATATLEKARSDAARADAAARGLRARINAQHAAAAASAAAPAGSCAPALEAGAVSAELLGRAVERARILADFADRSHAAGTACERSYEALRVTP